jgi:hypothetical protein
MKIVAPVDRPEIFHRHSAYLLAASPREAARAAAVDLARQLRLHRSLIGQLAPVMAMTAPDNIGG